MNDVINYPSHYSEVECGDMRKVLAGLAPETFDSCVTDPPYNLGFQNKAWDKSGVAFDPATWRAVYRVLKPGAYLICFGGCRTWHRIAVAIEDAGFEIRDNLAWITGEGMPKSKKTGVPGQGSVLKPSHEPVTLARKPLDQKTLAANVKVHGTGGINIDACRISCANKLGRWPPNVMLDEWAAEELDHQSGNRKGMSGGGKHKAGYPGGMFGGIDCEHTARGDIGGASRFMYCPKAKKGERDAGLDHWPVLTGGQATNREDDTAGVNNPRAGAGRTGGRRNPHPTVKPIALMRWLVRLVTPTGGLILDPFCGSGTTGCAAALEGFGFVGIDLDEMHCRLSRDRIAHWESRTHGAGAAQL